MPRLWVVPIFFVTDQQMQTGSIWKMLRRSATGSCQRRTRLADVAQRLGAVIKKVDAVNAVAEAENQTAGDDGGNQRGKNLRKHAHDLLQCVLVLLGCALDSFLRDTIDAGDGNKVIVEIADRIADDDLELTCWVKVPLADFSASILATSAWRDR